MDVSETCKPIEKIKVVSLYNNTLKYKFFFFRCDFTCCIIFRLLIFYLFIVFTPVHPVVVTLDNVDQAGENKMIYLFIKHVNEPYITVHCQHLCRDTNGRRVFLKSCYKDDSLRIKVKGKAWLAKFMAGIAYLLINSSVVKASPGLRP